jgi:hypothetical protein
MSEAFKRYQFIEKITSFKPGTHRWLDKLPEPWRSKSIILGYKLGLIKTLEYYKFQQFKKDGKTPIGPERITCNIITDAGATALRDIIAASFAGAGTNKQVYMDFGEGTTDPAVGDTDIETQPAGTTPKIICTVTSPGSYEVRCEAFINDTWGTRTLNLTEFGLFDDSADATGNMISRAKIVPTEVITGSNTAKGTYGILVR